MSHYVKFVNDMEENSVDWDIIYLLSEIRLKAFISFYQKLDKAPNTIGNHAKTFNLVIFYIIINLLIYYF